MVLEAIFVLENSTLFDMNGPDIRDAAIRVVGVQNHPVGFGPPPPPKNSYPPRQSSVANFLGMQARPPAAY